MNDYISKAKELGWPDTLINKLSSYDAELFRKLVDEQYTVTMVSPDETVEILIYMGGWWKLIFGDVDIIGVDPYDPSKGQFPVTKYKLRLYNDSLIQYFIDLRHPLMTVKKHILYYCP